MTSQQKKHLIHLFNTAIAEARNDEAGLQHGECTDPAAEKSNKDFLDFVDLLDVEDNGPPTKRNA